MYTIEIAWEMSEYYSDRYTTIQGLSVCLQIKVKRPHKSETVWVFLWNVQRLMVTTSHSIAGGSPSLKALPY